MITHIAILIIDPRRSRYSNGLSNIVALIVKGPNPRASSALRPLELCFFCFFRNLDRIGSSFRSNAFDKILTSRCSSKKGATEREGRRKLSPAVLIFRNANFYPRGIREVREYSVCVSITRCIRRCYAEWDTIAILQPIQTMESNLAINGE